MPGQPPSKPGLQAERTQLSWERTSLGFLAIGTIVLLRPDGPLAGGRVAVSAVSLVLALAVIAIGRVRARRMPASPRVAVLLVGSALVGLAMVIMALVAFSD